MNQEELFINLIPFYARRLIVCSLTLPLWGRGLSLEWLVDPAFAVWAGLDGVD
jgi:hypothetical protein